MNIINRNHITDLLRPNSIGCELGVFEGDFSETLLNSGKFSNLYLVDIFNGQASNFGKTYADASVLKTFVTNKFTNNSIITIIQQDSISFLKNTNIKFDFIYIDTIHSYDFLTKELIESYRCINDNGYICGHDYSEKNFPGVVRAVQEFCTTKNLVYNITTEKEDYPSFYIHISKK